MSKKMPRMIVCFTLCMMIAIGSAMSTFAWRVVQTRSINGSTLYAKADLPYWSDFSGGGNWAAQGVYSGAKTNNALHLAWSFYSVGGSVTFYGAGVSGSSSSPGSSFTVYGSTANASGRVYGNGLCLYVGMDVTSSFRYGNSYYSTTAHI